MQTGLLIVLLMRVMCDSANTVHSAVSRRRHCCLEFHSLPAALQEVGDALDEVQILQMRASAF